MTRLFRLLLFLTLALLAAPRLVTGGQDYAANVASLINREKLATLGNRGANPRVQKSVYWLEQSRLAGEIPAQTVRVAVAMAGYTGPAAALTEQSLLRNLNIAAKLGCLNERGLSKMRRGGAAVVTKGPYAGDIASVDHIIPRSVVPELDCVIANLELLPLQVNQHKNSTVGPRQRDLATRLRKAGLLSESGLQSVLAR